VYVANTGGDGLSLRRTPASSGEQIAVLPEGTELTPTGQEQQADGRRWRQVRDTEGREGWVAADFVSASVAAEPIPDVSPVAEGPTPLPTRSGLIPPPPPTPTRAPTRTPASSAPIAPVAPPPAVPANPVPVAPAPANPVPAARATPTAAPAAARPQAPAVIVPSMSPVGR
jgi:hypothetical protein